MSGASDKARYHIEQTVPELREWERRELFSKQELSSISSQRTHYETLLASREASPALCLRYFTHERNITALLSKRIDRKALAGRISQKLRARRQQHLFSILERSTRKFHGNLRLWAQYLDFCKEQDASKRVQRVVADMCRLFPTHGEVWEWAAGWAEQRGDVQQARGFWLRGCRFCLRDWQLRVAFARAEMRWVARARKTLGLQNGAVKANKEGGFEDEERDADMIAIPGAEDEKVAGATEADQDFAQFSSTPAMSGAIPIAVFDSAIKDAKFDDDAIEAFFAMFAEFPSLPCTPRILEHMLEFVGTEHANSDALLSCRCRYPLVGIRVDDVKFPGALRESLKQVKTAQGLTLHPDALAKRLLVWMKPLADDDRLLPELRQVVNATIARLNKPAGA